MSKKEKGANIPPRRSIIMENFSIVRIAVALFLALSIVFIIIYFVADDPWLAINRLVAGPFQSWRSFFSVIERAMPIIFTGLAMNVVLQSGIFNIGQDGAFYMGAVLASVVALKLPTILGVTQFVAILVSAVAGGIISMLPVLLYRYTNVNPIVSAIMFNSIFYHGGAYIVSTFILERSGTWGSYAFPKEAKLGLMIPKSKMHWGALILLLVYIAVVYLMKRTSLGMKIRIVGLNPTFAKNVGLNSGMIILGAQFLGGSIAGMGGAIEMLGMYQRFLWQGPVNYVWDGLMVHMLANGNPTFIPVTAIFIAFLRIGSEIMSRSTNIPPEVVAFLQGIVIVLVASSKFLYGFKEKYDRKISLARVQSGSEGELA